MTHTEWLPKQVDCIDDLPTPALVFDSRVVAANIQRMADYGRKHNLKIRPHTKTHKSLKIAQMQLDAGACGLTVAKVGEGEVMSELDAELLIAYPAFDPGRRIRVARLAKQRKVIVAVDSILAIQELATVARAEEASVGILVDLDVGLGRTGVPTPHAALELAQHVDRESGSRSKGSCAIQDMSGLPRYRKTFPFQSVSAI